MTNPLSDGWVNIYTPKLVERCRKFESTLGPRWGELWRQLGIAEAINLPEDRPPI